MLAGAQAEVAGFLARHADLKTDDGRNRLVRHGHLPEREVMTAIDVRRAKAALSSG